MIPALEIENLSKVYDNDFEALKGISLRVEQGDFFALLGPNGAGKSTTIGIICSLVAKSAGKISVFGIDIDEDFPAAKRHIGIVPQEFNFNQFEKGLDIVINQAGYYGLAPGAGQRKGRKVPARARVVGAAGHTSADVVRRNEAPFDDCPVSGP